MCDVLQIARSMYYYQARLHKKEHVEDKAYTDEFLAIPIKTFFKQSHKNYETRKIKKELEKQKMTVSRRRIGSIMRQYRLVSNYTVAHINKHVMKHYW